MQIIEDRRALHRIPELGYQLPETLAYVRASLEKLSCAVFAPIEGAVCAFFDFGRESAVAFRADMDALPITERTGLPFASTHPGRMHACGHDGHMAIALELARRLDEKKSLPHNVLLVFQPAEETIGGAEPICRSGVFEKYKVDAIFGLHLWPGLAEGVCASRANEMMARSSEIHITVTGRSSHIAHRESGVDALAAGHDLYARLRALEASFPANVYRILNFGHMESGTVCNAISGFTKLDGTLRAFQDEVYDALLAGVSDACRQVDAQYGTKTEVQYTTGYPAVMNPPELVRRVGKLVDLHLLADPVVIAEDFSWYQRFIPGMFFFLGVGDVPMLHSDDFYFNEDVLLKGAALFETLAENF